MSPIAQQGLADRGQAGAVAAPVEQRHVEILLQFLDGVGDGGRDAVQLVRGGGEAAFAVDGIQNLQGVECEAHGGNSVA